MDHEREREEGGRLGRADGGKEGGWEEMRQEIRKGKQCGFGGEQIVLS